jgi:hypothetical protein
MLKISNFSKLSSPDLAAGRLNSQAMASFKSFFNKDSSKEKKPSEQDILYVSQETNSDQDLISADFDAVKKTEYTFILLHHKLL